MPGKRLLAILSILFLTDLCAICAGPTTARNGMVASSEPLASQAGVQILQAGGNAVDAAAAVGFALAVTFPQAGNLGGGGFMLIRKANGEAVVMDYREEAPEAATRTMFLDANGKLIPDAAPSARERRPFPERSRALCSRKKNTVALVLRGSSRLRFVWRETVSSSVSRISKAFGPTANFLKIRRLAPHFPPQWKALSSRRDLSPAGSCPDADSHRPKWTERLLLWSDRK